MCHFSCGPEEEQVSQLVEYKVCKKKIGVVYIHYNFKPDCTRGKIFFSFLVFIFFE